MKFLSSRAAELPHKLPHLALMISFLSVPPSASETTKTEDPPAPSIGVQIIRDLARTFQLHIDNRRWRSTRLYLHLFGHLHALSRPLVSSQSLLALLRAIFSATTDELTCTGARADECLRIVCEGLLRSNLLKSEDDEVKKEVNELVESIRVHMVVNRRLDRSLFNESDCLSQYIDVSLTKHFLIMSEIVSRSVADGNCFDTRFSSLLKNLLLRLMGHLVLISYQFLTRHLAHCLNSVLQPLTSNPHIQNLSTCRLYSCPPTLKSQV
jgi:hypothetical protein